MARKLEKTEHSFEEDMKRLEEIVQKLEEGVQLEEALSLYEEGIRLSKKLENRLSEIERKVYEVKNIEKLASGEDKEMEMGLFK